MDTFIAPQCSIRSLLSRRLRLPIHSAGRITSGASTSSTRVTRQLSASIAASVKLRLTKSERAPLSVSVSRRSTSLTS